MPAVPGGLGRKPPTDWRHVERYAMLDAPAGAVAPYSDVALGINWYVEFDHPEKDEHGHWWVARDGKLTRIRGGHCIAVPRRTTADATGWWTFYDQGDEGACVGFGLSRVMSLIRRQRFNGFWLWDKAKARDEWPDTNPGDEEGTSVRAGLEVLRATGALRWSRDQAGEAWELRDTRIPDQKDRIVAYRWATSANEVKIALGNPSYEHGMPFLNSWGRLRASSGYPHTVWMPWEIVERVIGEDGEAAIITEG